MNYERQLLIENETKITAAIYALHDHLREGYFDLSEKMKAELIRLRNINEQLKKEVQS